MADALEDKFWLVLRGRVRRYWLGPRRGGDGCQLGLWIRRVFDRETEHVFNGVSWQVFDRKNWRVI